ncbi:MAG: geranylgeranylglycerol-phosphate geranylgeranyltransferase [Bacteroidota bacterium]
MRSWMRVVRLSNLCIVAFSQFFIYFMVLLPAFHLSGIPASLDSIHLSLLVLTTVLIAAGGYVINDIKDMPIDRQNRPEKVVVGKVFSLKTAYWAYWLITIIGLSIALYLALYIENLPLVLIYPAAVGLLWWYSNNLKKTPFWGNLVVAVFCAFVTGIVWFAERNSLAELRLHHPDIFRRTTLVLSGYMFFAFISTFYREIVKDMEDIHGDKAYGCRTLPIVHGLAKCKRISIGIGLFLLSTLLAGMVLCYTAGWWVDLLFVGLSIALPLVYSLLLLKPGEQYSDFRKASRLAKLVMMNGLLYLLVFYFHRF